MISKNHRQNHNFQIAHFLVGSCHTYDAAYALLQDLREERVLAIENYEVSKNREEAKRIRAKRLMSSPDAADRLEGMANSQEIENNAKHGEVLYQAALEELNFIDKCIEKIQPHRKYRHLSDADACQAMQQEEWRLELIHRAENYILTMGTVPADHFVTMRMHPEFVTSILPAINEMRQKMQLNGGADSLLVCNKKLLEMNP